MLADWLFLVSDQYSIQLSSDRSVNFCSAFHCSPSIGKPRMTPVSFVKTTETYEVSLVTINRQTSHDYGILLDYGITLGSPSG